MGTVGGLFRHKHRFVSRGEGRAWQGVADKAIMPAKAPLSGEPRGLGTGLAQPGPDVSGQWLTLRDTEHLLVNRRSKFPFEK